MSEDEEKCRLTYKEGREIARKTEKPYEAVIYFLLCIPCVMGLAALACQWLEGIPLHPMGDSIAGFVDSGEISQEFGWYLKKSFDAAMVMGAFMGSFCSIIVMVFLSMEARKKAIREANEEKNDRE